MADITVLDFLNSVNAAKAQLDALFIKLRALAPTELQAELDVAKGALDAALTGFDATQASADLAAVAGVLKSFGGVVGDGVGTDLNP